MRGRGHHGAHPPSVRGLRGPAGPVSIGGHQRSSRNSGNDTPESCLDRISPGFSFPRRRDTRSRASTRSSLVDWGRASFGVYARQDISASPSKRSVSGLRQPPCYLYGPDKATGRRGAVIAMADTKAPESQRIQPNRRVRHPAASREGPRSGPVRVFAGFLPKSCGTARGTLSNAWDAHNKGWMQSEKDYGAG